MKKLLVLIAAAAALVCCKTEELDLTGVWLQDPLPQGGWGQGIRLNPDGTADEVNLPLMILDSWQRQGDKLILTGKSISNRIAFPFSDTLVIDKRTTNDSLYLRQGDHVKVLKRLK